MNFNKTSNIEENIVRRQHHNEMDGIDNIHLNKLNKPEIP